MHPPWRREQPSAIVSAPRVHAAGRKSPQLKDEDFMGHDTAEKEEEWH